MDPRLAAYGAVMLVGALAYLLVPVALLGDLAWLTVLVATLAAVHLGQRAHRPSTPRPWWLLQLGLACMALAFALELSAWGEGTLVARRWASDLLALSTFLWMGLAALAFAHAQTGGHERAPALDSLLLMVTSTGLLWDVAWQQHGGVAIDTSSLIAAMGMSLGASWAAGMTVRMLLAGGHRSLSGRALGAAAALVLAGVTVHVVGGITGRMLTGGPIDLVWALALAAMGITALHPSMRTLTAPFAQAEVGRTRSSIGLLSAALLLPPTAILMRQALGDEPVLPATVATVCVAALVVVRFGGLVIDRERARQAVLAQSLIDPLTGLGNRAAVMGHLEQLAREGSDEPAGSSYAVVFLDLDDFKAVNDTWGHAAGDHALISVAQRLRAAARASDRLGRIAGDEFVLVAAGVDASSGPGLRDRLAAAFSEPIQLGPAALALQASIGIAYGRVGIDTASAVLGRADDAMYEVKRDRPQAPSA